MKFKTESNEMNVFLKTLLTLNLKKPEFMSIS